MESRGAFIQAKKKVAQGTMADMSKVRSRVKWKRLLFATLLVAFSLLALTGSIQSENFFWYYAAETVQAAQGTVTITAAASAVSVTSRVISSTNCGTSCGSGNNITGSPRPAVTAANNEEWWSGIFVDTGGLSDFDGVIVYVYKSGATIGAFNTTKSYGFRWVRKGYNVVTAGDTCPTGTGTPAGCFQELTVTGWKNSLTYLVSADSSRPTWSGAGPTSGTWTFGATISSLALYTDSSAPNHWNFEADGTSKSGSHPTGTRTGTLDMNMYLSLTLPIASINNATAITPGATNQQIGTTTWTYTSNAPISVQMVAGQNLTNEYGDQIPIADTTIGSVSPAASCSMGSTCISLSLSNQNYQTNQPVQVSPTNTMYWYLSPPSVVVPGGYTFTYTMTIAWNNQYPS
jgi:hypothetical protein